MRCEFACFSRRATSCESIEDDLAASKQSQVKEEQTIQSVEVHKRTVYISFITLTAIIIVSIIIGWTELFRMPKVNTASAPPYVFSEERARIHLNQIAQRLHPFGSEDNRRVANYIISYASSLSDMYGSNVVEVQTQNVTTDEYIYYQDHINDAPHEKVQQLVNVAILIKGIQHDVDLNEDRKKDSSIMISCNYDGVAYGPAASANGVSCATMLELASVLSSSPSKLKRDVLLLFTDAKEFGLLGATNFFEGRAHPWSLLPSVAISLENAGLFGKEMFETGNSRFAADAYIKYAAHPKAFSFSEWYDNGVEDRWNDAVIYEKHGLHTLRLGCRSNSWAYHSIDDDIENVSKGALQHMGQNVLAIAKGLASELNFPVRIERKEVTIDEKENSGLFYFTIIGGYIFSLPSQTASALFSIIALLMMMTMPSILFFTNTNSVPSRTVKSSIVTRSMHFLFAILNFILGNGACIIAFAACCLWKQPTKYQLESKPNAEENDNLAWGGLGYLASTLSCFSVLCTSLFIYLMPRKILLRQTLLTGSDEDGNTQPSSTDEKEEQHDATKDEEKNEEEDEEDEEESEITIEPCNVPKEINAVESVSQEISMLGLYGAEGAPPSPKECTSNNDNDDIASQNGDMQCLKSSTLLTRLGKDVYVGVFYFFAAILFILSTAFKDSFVLVLGQSVFMWLGATFEMILSWCFVNEHWLIFTRAFLSTVPALLFLSSSVYSVLSDFWYFPNFWFGPPAIDALCFGLIVPLFLPHLVMVPWKTYRIVGSVAALGFIAATSVCIVVSMSKPRFVF